MVKEMFTALFSRWLGRDEGGDAGVNAILPPEGEITQLLERSEGVAWQSEIQAELDWSASKTSRVLSSMEDNERVMRVQVGRQKVVYLQTKESEQVRQPLESVKQTPPTP